MRAAAQAQHTVEQVVPPQALSPAEAEASNPKAGLSGDWGGARTRLREDGVAIVVNHMAQLVT